MQAGSLNPRQLLSAVTALVLLGHVLLGWLLLGGWLSVAQPRPVDEEVVWATVQISSPPEKALEPAPNPAPGYQPTPQPPRAQPLSQNNAQQAPPQAPTAPPLHIARPAESAPSTAVPVPAPASSAWVPTGAAVSSTAPAAPAPGTTAGTPSNAPEKVVLPSSDADYLKNPAPTYPRLSKRMGEQGTVLIRVFINTDGVAEQAQLRSSSGYPRLDEAALSTVQRWRFVPGKRKGVPEAMWFNVPIHFVLD